MNKMFIVIGFILLVNSIILITTITTQNMFILKIRPLSYAMVFAHGGYHEYIYYNGSINGTPLYLTIQHETYFNGNKIATKDLIEQLRQEGYGEIWLSQCDTGDKPFMYYTSQTHQYEYWPDYVSRNERAGMTIPIYVGIGFIRL